MTTQQTTPTGTTPATPATPPADFLRYEARFTEVLPIGLVPSGLRIDAHYAGTVVDGSLAGSAIRGIDYLLIRPDGVSVLDVHALITTPAGEPIEVRAHGYGQGRTDAPLPPPEVLRSPAFRWPDAATPILGVAFCQTAAPALAWLNRTVFVYAGSGNLGTGELQVAVRGLTPEMVVGQSVG